MINQEIVNFIGKTLDVMPQNWIKLTTHRLDLYNESRAKVEFLEQFESILNTDFNTESNLESELTHLPTAFDYIRLGHPLSCVLEWVISKSTSLGLDSIISFSSRTMPILAILRKNHFLEKETKIYYTDNLPENILHILESNSLSSIYNYGYDLIKVSGFSELLASEESSEATTIYLSQFDDDLKFELSHHIDFNISIHSEFGSLAIVNNQSVSGKPLKDYINEIQHVRRRESIAMTPTDCYSILNELVTSHGGHNASNIKVLESSIQELDSNTSIVQNTISEITGAATKASLGSCGLSVQYAILMGLVDHTSKNHPDKNIKLIVPPNCYGGTNDQARRVAACIEKIEILDLAVDGHHDMSQSITVILDRVASEDAIALIIAEIPTNPRVEVPDMEELRVALTKQRKTKNGDLAIAPVFILDQTFCPNVSFLAETDILSAVQTISYVSGSKFPSGGLCTAGYCVGNKAAADLLSYIDYHLNLCDNTANAFQIDILAKQMPSMLERIQSAYEKTREFVSIISSVLPQAKINFVSEELALEGFTPSVFSLDLPTRGETDSEKEKYKSELNHKLIKMMISAIPHESKHCVSYGQLKGCYWTIPATSTQGTTKEKDKDYIVRVSIAPEFDVQAHKDVFIQFCKEL